MSRACALSVAQVAMPPISLSASAPAPPKWPSAPRFQLVISLPVATGSPPTMS